MSKYPDWTEEEIKILKDNYSRCDKNEIILLLPNRKIESINMKASKLGLKKENHRWSKDDIDILNKMFEDGYSISEMVDKFNRKHTYSSIQSKANKLGLKTREKWSDEEIKVMIDHYQYEPIDDFIDMLNNRSRHAVIGMAIKLNLNSYLTWKQDEVDFLLNNWNVLNDCEIALKLNKSQLCVKTKRHSLKLYRIDMSRKNYENLAKFLRSNNSEWKKKSIESCDYKCILTRSKNFDVHHIVNVATIIKITLNNLNIDYKNFEDYSEEELNLILNEFLKVQNEFPIGVCLRKDLHVLYHSLYGQQNNNIEQFNNFIKEYKNGTFYEYIENKSFTKCVETAGDM